MMSAYVVFTHEKTLDQGELDVYAKEVQTTVAGHEVKMLAFYGSHEDLEGPPRKALRSSSSQVLRQRRLGITVRPTGKCVSIV
jgi:Domain of unknown function (DUF1330)